MRCCRAGMCWHTRGSIGWLAAWFVIRDTASEWLWLWVVCAVWECVMSVDVVHCVSVSGVWWLNTDAHCWQAMQAWPSGAVLRAAYNDVWVDIHIACRRVGGERAVYSGDWWAHAVYRALLPLYWVNWACAAGTAMTSFHFKPCLRLFQRQIRIMWTWCPQTSYYMIVN